MEASEYRPLRFFLDDNFYKNSVVVSKKGNVFFKDPIKTSKYRKLKKDNSIKFDDEVPFYKKIGRPKKVPLPDIVQNYKKKVEGVYKDSKRIKNEVYKIMLKLYKDSLKIGKEQEERGERERISAYETTLRDSKNILKNIKDEIKNEKDNFKKEIKNEKDNFKKEIERLEKREKKIEKVEEEKIDLFLEGANQQMKIMSRNIDLLEDDRKKLSKKKNRSSAEDRELNDLNGLIKDKKNEFQNFVNQTNMKLKEKQVEDFAEAVNEFENQGEGIFFKAEGKEKDLFNEGLNNHQIDYVLSDYPGYYGCVNKEELTKIIKQIGKDKPEEYSFLFLIKDKDHPNGHWVCVYCDVTQRKECNYFDSFGNPAPKFLRDKLELLHEKYYELPYKLKWKWNSHQLQPYDSKLCGMYCIWILEQLYNGYDFKEATNHDDIEKLDDKLEKKAKIIFDEYV